MSGLFDRGRLGLIGFLSRPERSVAVLNRLESLEKAVELMRHQRLAMLELCERCERVEARLRMREVRARANGDEKPELKWHGSMLNESGG